MKKISLLIIIVSTLLFSQDQEQSVMEKIRRQQAAQDGALTGKVRDEKSGEDLIGANVFIVNTKFGASTDIDGRYQIKRIAEGIYDVRISFLGYETKLISGVIITKGEPIILDVTLNEDQGIQQQEVVVSASAIKSGEGAVLAERKKAASIGDAISSEQMKKAPDATSGDVLKRVTGVTLVDNKFLFVRGVTDRYNQTMLNGASVPSTSVDKKSFSFDMLPSNLLDNMNVAKTASPDLPGDFTGGMVQVHTLDIPEKLSVKFVAGASLNSITTFKDFYRTQGGNTDVLGSDDGIRAFPDQKLSNGELAKTLPNTWGSKLHKGPLAQSFSISIGDRIDFEEDQLGIIAALSYRNNYQHSDISIVEYGNHQLRRRVSGASDKLNVLWGGIFDLSYKLGEDHKFGIKNNLNRSAEDKVYRITGYTSDEEYIRSFQTEWEQRSMYSGQITGEHAFPEFSSLRLDWLAFYSDAKTEQPDRKELVYGVSIHSSEPYAAKPGERSWGNIYEKNSGEKVNVVFAVPLGKIKAGIVNERRAKRFGMEFYQIQLSNPLNSYLSVLPIDSIYSQENFDAGEFFLYPFTESSGAFSGTQDLFAYYTMVDIPFSVSDVHFRLTGGARVERSAQNVTTKQGRLGSSEIASQISNTDVLPSVNLVYIITENQNLRLAYSHTVNRPEFREMSDMSFYDFDRSEYVHGNANIKRALIRNYDLRYEIFLSYSDLFAFSYFYKSLTNPIEEFRTFTSYTERTWVNAEKATNYGWEFETRKNLGFLGEYFIGSQLVANYTRIISTIPYRENKGNSINPEVVEGERPMQGQSPYMYNISLFFTEPALGTSFNILYNEYGSRIDAIGDIRAGDGDVYEQKRGTVDLSITQPLTGLANGFEAKFSAKNLNNQPIVYTQGKEVQRKHNPGISYSLQFSYSL